MGLEKADEITGLSYLRRGIETNMNSQMGWQVFHWQLSKDHRDLNGIDIDAWDPATDKLIPKNFSLDRVENRTINKKFILEEFGLEKNAEKPLLILISRLSNQKGIDLIIQGMPKLFDNEWSAIFLGSGQRELEVGLKDLEAQLPDRIRLVLELIIPLLMPYSSGDIILMPSL
jgi:starch synthase